MNPNTKFLTNMRRLIRIHDHMLKPVCEIYHLSSIEAAIVCFLHNNPGKDTAADIVEFRMLSKGNVSQAVESLIQKGLLSRKQDTEDRRKIHLFLQPAARQITEEIEAVREKFQEKIFAGFSQEERLLFHELNDRFIRNIESAAKEGVRR